MKFSTHIPCDRLKPYIKHFILSENNAENTYKVLPGTSLVIGFQYSGRLTYLQGPQDIPLNTAGITGLMGSFRLFKNTPDTSTLLVVFKETGAAHFLKQPVHELFDESLSLDNFFNRDQLAETEEKLAAASDDKERITVVEQLLLDQLSEYGPDKLVAAAIIHIHQNNGTLRISDLADKLNISQSPLEKRFRKIVGSSPKKFASIVRNKYITAALTQYKYGEAVFLSGYYDQAHMIKDFKAFTGITPEQYLKSIRQEKEK